MRGIRILAVAATLAIGASPASAQGFMAGWVSAGANLTVDGQDVETGTVSGFTGGIVFSKASGLIGFRTEALYTQKGFTVGSGNLQGELSSAYIDIPVMLAVDALIVRAYAGPQFSIRVSCKITGNATNLPEVGSDGESCSDEVESFDFGFKGGVGAKIAVFTVDLVGTLGTKNFAKNDKDTVNAKNETLSIVVGLSLP